MIGGDDADIGGARYLVEKYDTENKLSYPAGTNEYYLSKQWLYFQVSSPSKLHLATQSKRDGPFSGLMS